MTKKEFRQSAKGKPREEKDAQFFLNILIRHFLGNDWYSQCWNAEDINEDAVSDIIRIYPRPSIKRAYRKVFGVRK